MPQKRRNTTFTYSAYYLSEMTHLVDGDNMFPGQRQRAGGGTGRLEGFLTEVAAVDTAALPGEAIRDHLPEP